MLACAAVISLLVAIQSPYGRPAGIAGILTAVEQPRKLEVSLSFDIEDSEDENETMSVPLILRTLERHNAKGTFFITGEAAEKNPELVKNIYEASHEIGLHTDRHLFPIFDEGQALLVAKRYGSSLDYVWMMSLKTPDAFRRSLDANKEAIRKAAGDISIISFRSPCLVTNWGGVPEYYEALFGSGILIDSSVMQGFESWDSMPIPIYERDGIIEVPVTRSDDILVGEPWNILNKMQKAGTPAVLLFHPKGFGGYELERLDSMLSEMEERYDTSYLTMAEAAGIT